MKLCVGLFGTCDKSLWRDKFMSEYNRETIEYFNPNKPDWSPDDAVVEAEHLAEDMIILFPITHESYGLGSLSEVGFSILNAIKLDDRRDFVILIDKELDERLDDPGLRKESLRARALVFQHLKKMRLANLYVVETLDEMLNVSKELWKAAVIRYGLIKFNPHNK